MSPENNGAVLPQGDAEQVSLNVWDRPQFNIEFHRKEHQTDYKILS